MSLQQCNKVCANIEQNFTTAEQTRARANIGIISPLAGTATWCQALEHTVTAEEASVNEVSGTYVLVQLPQMPAVIRNTTGKNFIAKAVVYIREIESGGNYKIGGSHAILLELLRSSTRVGNTMCLMTDLGETIMPQLATTITFSASSSDAENTYKIRMSASPGVIPVGTILKFDVDLQYVQSL